VLRDALPASEYLFRHREVGQSLHFPPSIPASGIGAYALSAASRIASAQTGADTSQQQQNIFFVRALLDLRRISFGKFIGSSWYQMRHAPIKQVYRIHDPRTRTRILLDNGNRVGGAFRTLQHLHPAHVRERHHEIPIR
jgi:hypothetical protein